MKVNISLEDDVVNAGAFPRSSAPRYTDMKKMEPCKLKCEDWRKLKTLLVNSCKESPDAFSAFTDENTPDHEFKGWARKWSRGVDEIAFILSNNQGEGGIIQGNVSCIGHLWVHPNVRRDKYATELLGSFLDWARERNVSSIYAFVTEANSEAIRFYKSAGFIATGESTELRPRSEKRMIKMKLEI